MIKDQVTGQCKIYKHENYDQNGNKRVSYSTQWGQKKFDGTWDNVWVNVQFRKDTEPVEAKTEISIKNGWWKYTKNEKGYIKNVYLFINEYGKVQAAEPTQVEFDNFTAAEVEIPF